MSTPESSSFPKVLTLYLELSQYPILADRIREHMRKKLFERGVISAEAFEAEVRDKAIQSQRREGLGDSVGEEPPDTWAKRVAIVRDHLTDFYFAYNLPHELFEAIVRDVLADRLPSDEVVLTYHPELAPWDMLFSQGEAYERLPPEKRALVEHDLREIKVVLIKSMISDHLRYLGIAKEWFEIADLQSVRTRRLGRGKIGGKAAGIMLAQSILRKSVDTGLLRQIKVPASWFVGADVFYQFTQLNGLVGFANQKYKSESEIQEEYPMIRETFRKGSLPEDILESLSGILEEVGDTPLIVRSSSLLEDSFGTSFAGKYESYFCPNQASHEENLAALAKAITLIYASVYSPVVLLYRRRMGLIDYDERMAILIQVVQGRRMGDFFLPDAAGVAFSRNQFRWSPRIDRDAGFLRMVWGLGTRAVETVGGDYPRLVALSHPELRPDSDPKEIRRYSQRQVDLIDLRANAFRSLPVGEVVTADTRHLAWIGQRFVHGELHSLVRRPLALDPENIVITFDELLRRSTFARSMVDMLRTLESAYDLPVDVEFALLLDPDPVDEVEVTICLLQCRPQSQLEKDAVRLPEDVPEDKLIFVTQRLVPEGRVSRIRYVIYISPAGYRALATASDKNEIAQLIGRLNQRLASETFIMIGPGRWGSANPDLGIPVTYADIYNAKALVELFPDSAAPEPSYGTHFFQDLVEASIYPLAVAPGVDGSQMQDSFFETAPNVLAQLLPQAGSWADVVRVIDVPKATGGQLLELVMDGDADKAMAYLREPGRQSRL